MRVKRPWSFVIVAFVGGITLAACEEKKDADRTGEAERIKKSGSVLEGEFTKLKDTGKAWCCDDPSHAGAYNACLMTAKGFETAEECQEHKKSHDGETGHNSTCK